MPRILVLWAHDSTSLVFSLLHIMTDLNTWSYPDFGKIFHHDLERMKTGSNFNHLFDISNTTTDRYLEKYWGKR